jgi:ABC-type Fe3+-hydroxamate transport system substrate-binding protein
MKKNIFIFVLIITSLILLLSGCSSNQSTDSTKTTVTTTAKTAVTVTVKPGRYFGLPYNLTSSFLPILTLEEGNKFKFEAGFNKTVEGSYKVDSTKLVLTSSDQAETYKFSIKDNLLIIDEEITDCVKKDTEFKLAEQFIIE